MMTEATIGGGVGVRERILAAAIEAFARTGYHRTSLRDIFERAGTNKPMVYYHYQSKDGLYLAAVRHLLEQTATRLRDTVAAERSAIGQLRHFAEGFLDAFVRTHPLLGVTLRELEGLDATLRHAVLEEYARLVGVQLRVILEDGVASGEFRALDIDGCWGSITAILTGSLRLHRHPDEPMIRQTVAQVIDYYAVGLLSAVMLRQQLERGARIAAT